MINSLRNSMDPLRNLKPSKLKTSLQAVDWSIITWEHEPLENYQNSSFPGVWTISADINRCILTQNTDVYPLNSGREGAALVFVCTFITVLSINVDPQPSVPKAVFLYLQERTRNHTWSRSQLSTSRLICSKIRRSLCICMVFIRRGKQYVCCISLHFIIYLLAILHNTVFEANKKFSLSELTFNWIQNCNFSVCHANKVKIESQWPGIKYFLYSLYLLCKKILTNTTLTELLILLASWHVGAYCNLQNFVRNPAFLFWIALNHSVPYR